MRGLSPRRLSLLNSNRKKRRTRKASMILQERKKKTHRKVLAKAETRWKALSKDMAVVSLLHSIFLVER
jgi:hypothetical protein